MVTSVRHTTLRGALEQRRREVTVVRTPREVLVARAVNLDLLQAPRGASGMAS